MTADRMLRWMAWGLYVSPVAMFILFTLNDEYPRSVSLWWMLVPGIMIAASLGMGVGVACREKEGFSACLTIPQGLVAVGLFFGGVVTCKMDRHFLFWIGFFVTGMAYYTWALFWARDPGPTERPSIKRSDKSTAPMTADKAAATRFGGTVAVWFTTHFQLTSRDWDTIQALDGPHHPAAGYYRSDDPEILSRQLREIRRAGIDLIIYDAFATDELPLTDFSQDRALPMLAEALANQDTESRKLQLAIYIEKYTADANEEEYEAALSHIREHLAGRDFYFRYKGKPLVTPYLNKYPDSLDEVEWRNDDFTFGRIRPYQSDVWSYIHAYPQPMRSDWMVVCPGFDSYLEQAFLAKRDGNDDLETVRKYASVADREDGAFFERQLLRARTGDPDIIFISGWNDWQYGNQIEPAVEYGYKYVDLAARLLGRVDETAPYRVT